MLIRTDFQTRLASANVGEHIVYHTGDLMFARERGSQLDATANAAWDAHLDGLCHLVQKRIGPNTWEYIAIRRILGSSKPNYTGAYDADFLTGKQPRSGAARTALQRR